MPSKTIENHGQRIALEAIRPELATAIGATAKNGFAVPRGAVIGVITSGGLVRRRTRAAVTTAFATDAATGVVDDASVFVIGDVLRNAAGASVGTITAINLENNTITLSGNASVAVAIAANVFGSDGSQVARGVADEASDGDGDTQIPVIIGGYLLESHLSGLDATAKTELAGASVAGGIFKF